MVDSKNVVRVFFALTFVCLAAAQDFDVYGDYDFLAAQREYEAHASPIKPAAEREEEHRLPSYCDPPNPCPLGYTDADGCVEDFENTSEFSRRYQARQKCQCDKEHMNSCGGDDEDDINDVESDIFGQKVDLADSLSEPFLAAHIAAKKGFPSF